MWEKSLACDDRWDHPPQFFAILDPCASKDFVKMGTGFAQEESEFKWKTLCHCLGGSDERNRTTNSNNKEYQA